MKLKRSYVFLISLISLFLLLSFSAVSAASDRDNQISDISASDVIDDVDGIEDTNDNILSNSNILTDGDSDVLEDEGGDNTVVDSTATTVESENKTYKFGDNITVPVNVKDNEGQEIAFTNDTLIVSNGTDYNYTYNFTVNGSSITLKETLVAGEYILYIKFLGNDTYSASETSATLNITKTDTTIEASNGTGKVGGNATVPLVIKVESGRTYNFNAKNITVTCDGEVYNVTKVDGGIALVNFTKEPGDYEVLINFLGSQSCNPSSTTVTVRILANNTIKANDTIKVNKNTHNVTIPIVISYSNGTNVTNLTVTEDDLKLYLKYYNGTENITIEINKDEYELTGQPGNYTINFINDKVDNSQLTIVYKEGSFNETNKTINITEFINAKIEVQNAVADYQTGNFTFVLKDADTNLPLANTNVTISGVYFFSNVNGSSARPSLQFETDQNGLIFLKNVNMNKDLDF